MSSMVNPQPFNTSTSPSLVYRYVISTLVSITRKPCVVGIKHLSVSFNDNQPLLLGGGNYLVLCCKCCMQIALTPEVQDLCFVMKTNNTSLVPLP